MNWLKKLLHPFKYQQQIIINGKTLSIEWTERAEKALQQRNQPITIEMEIYFSCLVKKWVCFHEYQEKTVNLAVLHPAGDKINVWFHPVTSLACEIVDAPHRQPTTDIEINNLHHYYPKQLTIDFSRGNWEGSFH